MRWTSNQATGAWTPQQESYVRFTDPITKDSLTLGEWVSWHVQGVIRHWWFILGITLITILVWSTNNPTLLLWWNLAASYLAIFIESVVGLAMFGQTRRDAVILRHMAEQTAHIEKLTEQTRQVTERIAALEERIPHARTKQ